MKVILTVFRFNEVLVESGILLIHPLINNASDKMGLYKNAVGVLRRDKMRRLFRMKPIQYNSLVQMPIALSGNTMKMYGRYAGDVWSNSPSEVNIYVQL